MNLVTNPWIPCVMLDGTRKTASLLEIFEQSHQVRCIFGDTPLETASILRLLLAIIHRARSGPADSSVWASIWQLGRFGKPETEYLRQWQHRFNLYDSEHPFYQFVPEKETKMISIAKPQPDRVSGENGTLYDCSFDENPVAVSAAKAARIVIASQAFSLGEIHGFKHSHCARGDIYIVEGQSLFETLMLNLLPYNQQSPIPNTLDDRPAWEQDDPFHPERETPYGWLDMLTWQSRRMVLYPEADGTVRWMYWLPGLFSDVNLREPMMRYIFRQSTQSLLPAATNIESGAQWLNLGHVARSVDKSLPVMNVEWVIQLVREGWLTDYLNQAVPLRLGVYAMVNTKSRVDNLLQENLPFPVLDMAAEESALARAVSMAYVAGEILKAAYVKTKVAEDGNLGKAKKTKVLISHQFWRAVTPQFDSFFGRSLTVSDEDLFEWESVLRNQAENIYRVHTSSITSRGLRAYGQNVGLLRGLLKKYLKEPDSWHKETEDVQEAEEAEERETDGEE